MPKIKNIFRKVKKSHLQIASALLLIFTSVFLLWFNIKTSLLPNDSLLGTFYFDGEYRIEDGEWHKIVEGEHIPATEGDVTLRGNFHALTPDGQYVGIYRDIDPIALYADHINLTIYEVGCEPYVDDVENPLYGSAHCSEEWVFRLLKSSKEDTVEILIHNPHSFGNENAIDELLASVTTKTIYFEKDVLDSGTSQRTIGLIFAIVAIMLLGISFFSTLIHVKNTKIIGILGLVVLFAGGYFVYSSEGISVWSKSAVSNTTILGISMMLYMLFLTASIVYFLKVTKLIGNIMVISLAVVDAVLFTLPVITDILFYDTWFWWIFCQLIVNTVLSGCLIRELISAKGKVRLVCAGVFLPLIAFFVDFLATWMGVWKGGMISKCVFSALFVVAVVMVLKLIPRNINAAAKAKELELEKTTLNAQLAESRISTMMSQIRPHFVYNTLGSIEQLCKLDPPKAGDLAHNFAKYLRGNFGELDNPKPILMSQEMEHVHYYVSIENVRFPDMTFTFEMKSEDFAIPALTVQPIVENAIKHGLMKLSKGGTISVVSYETDTEHCISVVDNGVGFDTGALVDDRKHVGLRNIRERLKVMVNGTLEIESTVGVGTKVLIKIPKETRK